MSTRTKKKRPSKKEVATRPIGVLLMIGFVMAALSQANVQVVNRKNVMNMAFEKGRYEIEDDLMARRGSLLSSDGRILAQNQDVFDFQLIYKSLPKSPGFFSELSLATGISVSDLQEPALLGQKSRKWRTPLGGEEARAVRSIMRKWNADGVSLQKILRRDYPLGYAASGIVGLVRSDGAINGLERSLDKDLGGQNGEAKGFIDRTGAFMPVVDQDLKKLVQGKDVTLTVDSVLQFEASEAIKHSVQSNKADNGAIIIYEPGTGNILAMSNWPTFDPNASIGENEDLNVAYRGLYEPGSTFKIMTLAKALETGVYGQHDHIQCSGSYQVPGKLIRCSHGAHGDVDWEKAIAESCNVAASQWALKIGKEDMRSYIEQLGLLDKPGLGLPWETGGMHQKNDPAVMQQLAVNGFGQSLNATPVALASAYACLANGGVRMKPRLIAKMGEQEMPIQEAGRIVRPEVAEYVRQLMVSTIEKDFGTGKGLRIAGYQLAGKTGTAQRLQKGGQKGYVASFVGMVPAYQPKAVVLVMINNPTAGSHFGGSVAGPVFAEMAKTVIRRYGIAPDAQRVPQGPQVAVEISPVPER
ncbi:MAG: peptidoglycan D,D-transpeptidase FtsI family protein [Fimbriimonadaceae bacterium]